MITATFQFDADEPEYVRHRVSEMSGVMPALSGESPYQLEVIVFPPFDETRLDNVENIIGGLATNVSRISEPAPAASGEKE